MLRSSVAVPVTAVSDAQLGNDGWCLLLRFLSFADLVRCWSCCRDWQNEGGLGPGPASAACCRALLRHRFLLLPHHLRLMRSDRDAQRLVRWLAVHLACVERLIFPHQRAVPQLLLQLWLEAACQHSRQWQQSQLALRSPQAVLETERSRHLHLLDGSSPQQVAAISSRRAFWQLQHRGGDDDDGSTVLFDAPKLDAAVRVDANDVNAAPSFQLQLWYSNPHTLDIVAYAFAQQAVHDMRPPDAVLPVCAEAMSELDARVLWIGAFTNDVTIGYYVGHSACEADVAAASGQRAAGATPGVHVELSSRAECAERRQRYSGAELDCCPVLLQTVSTRKVALYRSLASWLLLQGLSRWYAALRELDGQRESQRGPSLPAVNSLSVGWMLTRDLRIPAQERMIEEATRVAQAMGRRIAYTVTARQAALGLLPASSAAERDSGEAIQLSVALPLHL